MPQEDRPVESASMPNEAAAPPPPALERLIAERAAVASDLEGPDDSVLVATDEEVQARAAVVRRIFDKLGVLPEMEELRELDGRRRDRLEEDERS